MHNAVIAVFICLAVFCLAEIARLVHKTMHDLQKLQKTEDNSELSTDKD